MVPGFIEKNPRNLLFLLMAVALVSSIFILTLASYGIYRVSARQFIANAERHSIHISQALLELERPRLLKTGRDGRWTVLVRKDDIRHLDESLRKFLQPFEIIKVKIYDQRRKIVYSTDRSIIDRMDPENPRLARALAGFNDSKLERKDKVLDLADESRFMVDVVETYVPIFGDTGDVIGSFEIYRDITPYRHEIVQTVVRSTALLAAILLTAFTFSFLVVKIGTRQVERVQERLREIATRDPLTGLLNRGEILRRAQEEVARLRRRPADHLEASLGIILLDIDHFKQVNDTHGHLAGDQVLVEVSTRLRETVRTYDFVGRFGGEEFLVVAPGASLATTCSLAERIRRIVHEKSYAPGEGTLVTVSAGVAVTQGDEEFSAALQRADEGLYAAKKGGRNRVSWVKKPPAAWDAGGARASASS